MSLDRLTSRARTALLGLPQRQEVLGVTVLSHIKKAGGLGNHLAVLKPNVKVHSNKKVRFDRLVKESYYQAVKLEHPYVGTEHILLALLKLTDSKHYNRVKSELDKLGQLPYSAKQFVPGKDTPILDSFSTDLTAEILRADSPPFVHRPEYDSLMESLLLKTSQNVLLVGDPGVGKDTLVKLLVKNVVYLEVPPVLAGYSVIEFDMVSFATGIFNKGLGIEASLTQLNEELKRLDRVILYIKNFQSLFISSSLGASVPLFYSLFLSLLESSNARVVATMNTEMFDKVFMDNSHILESFSVVEIPEPDEDIGKKILQSVSAHLSHSYNIKITDKVLDYVYEKASTFPVSVKYPRKAVSFLDQCCAHLLLSKGKIPASYKDLMDESISNLLELEELIDTGEYEKALPLQKRLLVIDYLLTKEEDSIFDNPQGLILTKQDVDSVISNNISTKNVSSERKYEGLVTLSDRIKKRIIGQEEAVDVVTKGLIRGSLGLRSRKRPLGNFLFLGPTGVGKTEFAKVLADEFYGKDSLIRLDMSDFGEKHTVARLVGAPPGYIGYGEGGELTSKISSKPGSVVLFDEIEKAHPDVLNILLQIMEEGELADARGQTFSFSEAIVVLTSNLGTEILHNNTIGFGDKDVPDSEIKAQLQGNLKKILKPELLNRFDEIVTFTRLSRESQMRILNLLIEELEDNLAEQQVLITIRKYVKNHILKLGYSKEYGARALRRTLEKELLDAIADYLLNNKNRPLDIVATVSRTKNKNILIKSKV